jgi:monoamine oxidase
VIEADYAIATLPLNILAGMPGDFSAPVRAALRRVQYDEASKVAFEAPRFWEADQIYGGISYVKSDTTLVWYPSHGFHAPSGIVLGAYASGTAARNLAKLPLADRIAAARHSIDRVHPGAGALLTRGVNVTWSKIPYNLGPWVKSWGHPPGEDPDSEGNDLDDYKLLNQPDGPIYFATANLSQTPGWQEGAARSALRIISMLGEQARTRKI